jgi:hypothetical protein
MYEVQYTLLCRHRTFQVGTTAKAQYERITSQQQMHQ